METWVDAASALEAEKVASDKEMVGTHQGRGLVKGEALKYGRWGVETDHGGLAWGFEGLKERGDRKVWMCKTT